MWHRRKRRRLGVKTKHRKALLRNLVKNLVQYRRIETTLARAKEASRLADQMVTLAKEGTLSARRRLISELASPDAARIFMNDIAPRLKDRKGGYTRILKLDYRRGDGAQGALLEFSVPMELPSEAKKKTGKPRKAKAAETQKAPEKAASKAKPEKAESVSPGVEPASEKAQEKGKEDLQKRGGFLSKLRKFLTGDEQK